MEAWVIVQRFPLDAGFDPNKAWVALGVGMVEIVERQVSVSDGGAQRGDGKWFDGFPLFLLKQTVQLELQDCPSYIVESLFASAAIRASEPFYVSLRIARQFA